MTVFGLLVRHEQACQLEPGAAHTGQDSENGEQDMGTSIIQRAFPGSLVQLLYMH